MGDALPSALTVPHFARLDEFFGLWAYHEERFAALWEIAAKTDLYRHVAAGPPQRPTTNTETMPAKGGKNVAVIRATGTLMKQQPSLGGTSTVMLRRDIRAAASDPTVSGILLSIDSPGGTVAGTADLAADVKAARKKKPVWAHIDDLGASAAYWLASQADAVYANSPTALIGSIGTLQVVYDYSAAAEKEGVKTLVFRTGPLKGAGIPGAPVSDEQAANFQRLVNETQTHFDSAVKSGRGMSQAQLNAARTGGVFMAGEAVGMKLIDGVQSFDKTLADLSSAR